MHIVYQNSKTLQMGKEKWVNLIPQDLKKVGITSYSLAEQIITSHKSVTYREYIAK